MVKIIFEDYQNNIFVKVFIFFFIFFLILPIVYSECGKEFQRFKYSNATCCSGLELQELPPDSETGNIEYRCVTNQLLRQQKEQEAVTRELMFLIIFLSFFFFGIIIYILASIRFLDLYEKEIGKSLTLKYYPTIGFNVSIHLFYNEYRDDKYYNILIWLLRIFLIIFIIIMILRIAD